MQYSIEGGALPVVIFRLSDGESLISEAGGRTWYRGDIRTENEATGGLAGSLGRMLSGEKLFMSRYTARGEAEIAFAFSFPGKILDAELREGESLICQKRAFLCATPGVQVAIHFQKKLGAGFFGGEGFVMQRVTGPGTAFFELDGHCHEYLLAPGERLVCDTGAVALMDGTCTLDIEMVKGLGNMMFGGEGMFNTTVTGPGKVSLQTMNLARLSQLLVPGASK